MRVDQCHVGIFRGIIPVVSSGRQTRAARSGTLVTAGQSEPATHTEKMTEHDRNPAARQADHPVDEDNPSLAALQQSASRDLTCQTDPPSVTTAGAS